MVQQAVLSILSVASFGVEAPIVSVQMVTQEINMSYLSVISTSATMVEAVTGLVPMSDVNVYQNGLVLHA